MGRLTISLPDDLESQLDAYAQAQKKPVSQVVAEAVRSLLNAPPAAAPSPTPPPPTPAPAPLPSPTVAPAPGAAATPSEGGAPEAAEDLVVRRYLEHLYRDLELLLEAVNDLSLQSENPLPHTPPYELPQPPWLGRRSRS